MKLQCECTYCGHKWIEHCSPYNVEYYKRDASCKKCRDQNLKFKEEQSGDIFGYHPKEKKDEKRTF